MLSLAIHESAVVPFRTSVPATAKLTVTTVLDLTLVFDTDTKPYPRGIVHSAHLFIFVVIIQR